MFLYKFKIKYKSKNIKIFGNNFIVFSIFLFLLHFLLIVSVQ